jgi:hypothetical protein
MQTASVAVPVARWPRSRTAWALASVTVATALTKAASARRSGTMATTLMVPIALTETAWSGAAARMGWPSPTVAQTSTPPSEVWTCWRTSTAVSIPTPRPGRPMERASWRKWLSGSRRPYDIDTWLLTTQRRTPRPPPWGAEEIARSGEGNRHTMATSSRPLSRRDRKSLVVKEVLITSARILRVVPGRQVPGSRIHSPGDSCGTAPDSHRVPCVAEAHPSHG